MYGRRASRFLLIPAVFLLSVSRSIYQLLRVIYSLPPFSLLAYRHAPSGTCTVFSGVESRGAEEQVRSITIESLDEELCTFGHYCSTSTHIQTRLAVCLFTFRANVKASRELVNPTLEPAGCRYSGDKAAILEACGIISLTK